MTHVNEETMKQNLARNMRYLRLSRSPRISQQTLANKLGTTQASISLYETAIQLPPAHILVAMAQCFGFTTDELLSDSLPDRKGMKINE